jgi:hypothetical protein
MGRVMRVAGRLLTISGFFLIVTVSFAWAINCSQTVSTVSTKIPFPTSGSGPAQPTTYFEVCNAHASNNLGVSMLGGTAAIGAAGTITLSPGWCTWRYVGNLPASPTVIGSAAGTTTACDYR